MQIYRNSGKDSGVKRYEIGNDYIRVEFGFGSTYLYTNSSAGEQVINEMKRLAVLGEGLNAYINTTVKKKYERKEA